jgi:GAF domain-containing protein
LELWLDGVQHRRLAHIQEKLNKRLQTLYRFKNVYDLAHETLELCNLILKCKRGWIGQLNRTGSHIEGLAAFGPGLGLKIARSQIELVLRHDYLDDAIKQKNLL